jgi:hypothetical protein
MRVEFLLLMFSVSISVIKMIIKKHNEQWDRIKSDNTDEMDKFLEAHKLPSMAQDKIEHLSRCIATC